jgi:hypothetical protein
MASKRYTSSGPLQKQVWTLVCVNKCKKPNINKTWIPFKNGSLRRNRSGHHNTELKTRTHVNLTSNNANTTKTSTKTIRTQVLRKGRVVTKTFFELCLLLSFMLRGLLSSAMINDIRSEILIAKTIRRMSLISSNTGISMGSINLWWQS